MSPLADSATWPPDGPESAVDKAVADLVRYYGAGYPPERTARYLLEDYGSDAAEEAVEWASDHYEEVFGTLNDTWTAAVCNALG